MNTFQLILTYSVLLVIPVIIGGVIVKIEVDKLGKEDEGKVKVYKLLILNFFLVVGVELVIICALLNLLNGQIFTVLFTAGITGLGIKIFDINK